MSGFRFYPDGRPAEQWDDANRKYRSWNLAGQLVTDRPYGPGENAEADAATLTASQAANGSTIGSKISTVDMPAMQAIIDQLNADLRADPSQELKDLAKAVRRLDRKVQGILDGTD